MLVDVIDFRERIVKRPIKDAIAEKITALIASGLLQIGDTLPSERDMAASLNVSRETVRGALQMLAGRGILEISQGARTRVVKAGVGLVTIGIGKARAVDAYDIEAVHASRLLVEREIVADAARRIDAPTLAILDASLEAQAEAELDIVRFLICDREFHFTIYGACGNALLSDFAGDLYAHMMLHRRAAVARPGAIAESVREHTEILRALQAHDPDASVKAFAAHTDRIRETTLSVMDEEVISSPQRGIDRTSG